MGSATSQAPIEFDGVVKRFGQRTVINDLSFTVPSGTIVGLLGPNGAGKSTAMRVLLGLQRATGGEARIFGHPPGARGFRAVAREVGVMIESPPLYTSATALENLKIRASALGDRGRDADLHGMLERVGLLDRANDRSGSFSLGMRQRLGIASALVGDPSIVVLDEPTNGLDPEGSVEIRNLVRSLPDRGATTLLSTHRLAEVEATCDYVVVLQQGHLVTQGSLDDIIEAASSGGLVISVAPDRLAGAMSVLRDLGLGEPSVEDSEIVLPNSPEDPAMVTRALAAQGIYLRGLRTRRATLEEAFLRLTQKAQGDEA